MIGDVDRYSARQVVARLCLRMDADGAGKVRAEAHEQCEVTEPATAHLTLDLPAHRSFRQKVGEPRRQTHPGPTD